MANAAYSRFPASSRADAPDCGPFDAEGIEEVIGMLKSMAEGTGEACAKGELNRLASSQLHRLEWILCQRTGHACARATELRARCAKRQQCLRNETSIPRRGSSARGEPITD